MKTPKPEAARICGVCRRPLTQSGPNGECLRCLASIWFLSDGEQPERPDGRGRLTPGPLRYAHFEVETGEDGFPNELGAGAMAITYRALDTVLNSAAALKVIDRRVAQNPEVRSRFLREARAAANIRHPNVARVTFYGEQDGECFYAMELVEGETLETRVRREGRMPLAQALEVAEQAARALVAAEACGVVHRDIKPSNIMVESDASDSLSIKLIDYGIAKTTGPRAGPEIEETKIGFIGTPAFASPEQFAAGQSQIDTRSDIYSLGVTLWYLLTGRVPFVGRTMEELHTRQTNELPLEQLKGLHLPCQVIALLGSMLAPDPKDRPQTARELVLAVHSCYERISPDARKRRRRTILIGAAAIFIIAATALGARLYQRTRPLPPVERSIAVLPFQNLSSDKENAYFAQGIQDEILTQLSKIADLKVISRTSTQHYKSAPKNLPEIAKQLGVAHVLEGSVQKSADAVRVNVQLIHASSDNHLWAETYDRKLADVFRVESEVAQKIAASLQAKLTDSQKSALSAKPTDNPAAYDAYLRGRAFSDASNWIGSNVQGSIQSYQNAVALDPRFALAWARLASELIWSYWQGFDASSTRLTAAKEATARAVALAPDLPEVHLALGFYHYYAERDYATALAEFRAARDGAPNDTDMIEAVAYVQRRLGHFEEAIAEMRRAIELSPRHLHAYENLAETYSCLRRFPEALTAAQDPFVLQPEDAADLNLKASLIWRSTGDIQAVEPLLANSTALPVTRATQFLFQRDYAAATRVLSNALSVTTTEHTAAIGGYGYLPDRHHLQLLLGLSHQRAGDAAAAEVTYQQAVRDIRRALTNAGSGSNVEVALHSALGEAYAGLGDAAAAIDEGQKAMAILPASKDAFGGPVYEENMARIFAQLGDVDRAIDLLQRLLQTPYDLPITPALLRLDPIWEPIRNDPRFQELPSSALKSVNQ